MKKTISHYFIGWQFYETKPDLLTYPAKNPSKILIFLSILFEKQSAASDFFWFVYSFCIQGILSKCNSVLYVLVCFWFTICRDDNDDYTYFMKTISQIR